MCQTDQALLPAADQAHFESELSSCIVDSRKEDFSSRGWPLGSPAMRLRAGSPGVLLLVGFTLVMKLCGANVLSASNVLAQKKAYPVEVIKHRPAFCVLVSFVPLCLRN